MVRELVQRFDQHFSKLGVKDFKKSFSGPLPLQEYFMSVDHHFQVGVWKSFPAAPSVDRTESRANCLLVC